MRHTYRDRCTGLGAVRYLSVCSGIEAATVAWHRLGWEPAAFSEIERFPRAVLTHHYPDVPLHGDFTTIQGDEYGAVDLLVGGTPCQSFSVAGLRKGMDDERGNLALEYLRLATRLDARWLVWENVPGVLSSNGGRDFGALLGGLAELGYGWAYRVLDAQFFGVPQRRRRVFVVGHSGGWRRAAAVLFERQSLSGHPAPSREAGPGVAALTANGVGTCGADDNQAQGGHLVAHTLRAEGFDASEDGTGRGTPLVPCVIGDPRRHDERHRGWERPSTVHPTLGNTSPQTVAFGWQNSPSQSLSDSQHTVPTLDKSKTPAVAFSPLQGGRSMPVGDQSPTLEAGTGNKAPAIAFANTAGDTALGMSKPGVPPLTGRNGDPGNVFVPGMAVRRITPKEAERLQGFPDDYTRVPYRNKPAKDCPDGPRYKALGNSMAVPVMAWIGERIQMVEDLA